MSNVKKIEWGKKYYTKNKEVIDNYNRNWKKANPEKVDQILKKWRTAHRKEEVIRAKQWIKENPEKAKKWRVDHRKEETIRLRQWRHIAGISKKYNDQLGISKTKEYKKAKRVEYKTRFKNAGKLTAATVQMVYEDNIKRFGTLTCYLCLKAIPFSKDHLEHKTPLSRGGTNEYNNLGVACQYCNCKKHNKTLEEFL
jgi:hypothetical protein